MTTGGGQGRYDDAVDRDRLVEFGSVIVVLVCQDVSARIERPSSSFYLQS